VDGINGQPQEFILLQSMKDNSKLTVRPGLRLPHKRMRAARTSAAFHKAAAASASGLQARATLLAWLMSTAAGGLWVID
jgi:hypothetical protein